MRLHRTLCHKWIAQDDARHKQAVTLLIRALAPHLFDAELVPSANTLRWS